MSKAGIVHHVPPTIVARRQKWLIVGVTILSALLLVLWFTNVRLQFGAEPTWQSLTDLWSEQRPAQLIEVSTIVPAAPTAVDLDAALQKINQLAASSTPTAPNKTTVEILKQKLK